MNHRMRKFLPAISVLALIIAVSYLAAGCGPYRVTDFPAISYIRDNSSAVSSSASGEDDGISSGTLRIALPLSAECLQYLAYMYVGESAGLFRNTQTSLNGLTIPLKTLEFYNVGLNTVLQITGSRGLTVTDVRILNSANNLPDIFLVSDPSVLKAGEVEPAALNVMYTEKYITPSSVYPTMISKNIAEKPLYTVPLYASVKMLYADRTLFDGSPLKDSSALRSPVSLQTVRSLSKQITDPVSGIYGFMGFNDLLAFLPSAISPFPSGYAWNGHSFDFENTAFAEAVTLLRQFAGEKSSVDTLTAAQKTNLYGNGDPRETNRIAFWIDDSDRLTLWNDYGKIERYPLPVVDRISLPLTVYGIAVNAKSALLKDAVRLAVYISLDDDALLFRSRYNISEGYLPPLSRQEIWDSLVAPQLQGDELMKLRPNMGNSHTVDGDAAYKVADVFDSLYDQYFMEILFGSQSLKQEMPSIQREAADQLAGG